MNEVDKTKSTPLHYAAHCGSDLVVSALIQSGSDINKADAAGDTPLHMAARGNDVLTVKTLLQFGAESSKKNDAKQTPAQAATAEGCHMIPRVLSHAMLPTKSQRVKRKREEEFRQFDEGESGERLDTHDTFSQNPAQCGVSSSSSSTAPRSNRACRRSSDREWIATRARAMTTAEDDVDEDALLYGDVGAWATTRGAFVGWNAAISTVFVR